MRPPLVLALVLVLVVVLGLGAGCVSTGPGGAIGARRVETHLGANARITVDGKEIARGTDGALEIPLAPQERQQVRVTEPRKPALVAEVIVLVDPKPEVEDRAVLQSTANTTVVFSGRKGAAVGAERAGVVDLLPDPLTYVRDADGPFFLPAGGQGIIVVASDHGAKATVDGKPLVLRPAEEGPGKPSLPAIVEAWPGWHTLKVVKPGLKPFESKVFVRGGEYALLAVRLAPETAGGGARR